MSIRNRLSNKKAYTERVYRSPADILLSEIVNKFMTSAISVAMIYSANTKIYLKKMFKYLLYKYMAKLDDICFFFSKKVQLKLNLLENFEFKNL